MKKYCDSTFIQREFKELVTTSGYTIERLENELGIKTKDKNERLILFNDFKRKSFLENEADRLKKHRKDFFEKYMKNREKWEFETLSIYLTSNPLKDGLDYIYPFENYQNGDQVTVIGTVMTITKKKGKNGQYAFIDFYNGEKTIELIFWSNMWAKYGDKITKGMDLAVIGMNDEVKVTVTQAKPYEVWRKEKKI